MKCDTTFLLLLGVAPDLLRNMFPLNLYTLIENLKPESLSNFHCFMKTS